MRILILIVALYISGCNQYSIQQEHPKYTLTKKELTQLFELIEVYENSQLNIHIWYNEYFNDSTLVLDITQNGVDPSEEIEPAFSYRDKAVFMYNSHKSPSTFFVPDADFWSVLVQRRNNINRYSKIGFFTGGRLTPSDSILINDEDLL